MELSSKETPIRVLMDHPEGRGKRFCIRARRVAVPFAIGPFPENAPDIRSADKSHLRDGLLDMLTGATEHWSHEEKLDGLPVEALPLADLVAQMQGRATARPEVFLKGDRMLGDFSFGEGQNY